MSTAAERLNNAIVDLDFRNHGDPRTASLATDWGVWWSTTRHYVPEGSAVWWAQLKWYWLRYKTEYGRAARKGRPPEAVEPTIPVVMREDVDRRVRANVDAAKATGKVVVDAGSSLARSVGVPLGLILLAGVVVYAATR